MHAVDAVTNSAAIFRQRHQNQCMQDLIMDLFNGIKQKNNATSVALHTAEFSGVNGPGGALFWFRPHLIRRQPGTLS